MSEQELHSANFETQPGERIRKPKGPFSDGSVILDRYEILGKLGDGGMGAVYKCRDRTTRTEVALKAIPPELARSELDMQDVVDNFQLIAGLAHPHIATPKTLDKNLKTGEYFLIMEYVDGVNLRRWLRQKRKDKEPVSLETTVPILSQVALALDFAHRKKVIHRDIKPENIMLTRDGEVKVLDFGLAAQIHTTMTRVSREYQNCQGGTSGTAPYMAPEQWKSWPQDAMADQYALGVLAYEMLAGRLPFESGDTTILREMVLKENAAPIPGISRTAQNAIARAMNKNPKERFASCTEFVAALGTKTPYVPIPSDLLRHKWWFVAAVIVLLFAVVCTFSPSSPSGKPVAKTVVQPVVKKEAVPEMETPVVAEVPRLEEIVGPLLEELPVLPELFEEPPAPNKAEEERLAANRSEASKYAMNSTTRLGQKRYTEALELIDEALRLDGDNVAYQEQRRKILAAKKKAEETPKVGDRAVVKVKGVDYAFHWCPAGKFMMGSPTSELGRYDDEKQHQVTLTKGFWMLETQVTQEMWESVTGSNPSNFKDSKKLPVETVSWEDCQDYIRKLNALGVAPAGYKFSLPTEAQWEYACRAGTTTALNSGKNLTSSTDACPNLNEVGWYYKNSDSKTHEVGLKKPNAWGLYDMHGNVYEWCFDWYASYPDGSVTDPTGPDSGSYRVLRGGSWSGSAGYCRSAFRHSSDPSSRSSIYGARLALVRE